jgi:hypothetical protein
VVISKIFIVKMRPSCSGTELEQANSPTAMIVTRIVRNLITVPL